MNLIYKFLTKLLHSSMMEVVVIRIQTSKSHTHRSITHKHKNKQNEQEKKTRTYVVPPLNRYKKVFSCYNLELGHKYI